MLRTMGGRPANHIEPGNNFIFPTKDREDSHGFLWDPALWAKGEWV